MGRVQAHKRAEKAKRQVNADRGVQAVPADCFPITAVATECLPNTMFRIQVTESPVKDMIGKVLTATLVGKMRLYRIRVIPGDLVSGYVSKYDLNRGKITYRSSKNSSQ